MAQKEFLEVGRVVNTHGVRGELKLEAWTDTPEVLAGLKCLRLADRAYAVQSARVHGGFVLMKLAGVDTVEAAMALKGRVLTAERASLPLAEGAFFLEDLMGLPVYDEGGAPVGALSDVLDYPAGRVFVVRGAEGEHLIPEQGGFLREVDLNAGRITVRLIEGM